MKKMSFYYTQQQIKDRTKTVTRRLGWKNLVPGEIIVAVNKQRFLKKGEQRILAVIKLKDIRREPIYNVSKEDCIREGFPYMTPDDFVQMFCIHMKCQPTTIITRIEFEYIERGN